jgi:hypothetical protein
MIRTTPALLVLLTSVCMGQTYSTPQPGDPLRGKVLDALRPEVEEELGQEVLFKINDLRVSERFAFVSAQPLTNSQEPIDYSKTKYAEDVKEGIFDDWLCALLVKEDDKWNVVALEIGATDVPFVGWPEAYGVPREVVFGRE